MPWSGSNGSIFQVMNFCLILCLNWIVLESYCDNDPPFCGAIGASVWNLPMSCKSFCAATGIPAHRFWNHLAGPLVPLFWKWVESAYWFWNHFVGPLVHLFFEMGWICPWVLKPFCGATCTPCFGNGLNLPISFKTILWGHWYLCFGNGLNLPTGFEAYLWGHWCLCLIGKLTQAVKFQRELPQCHLWLCQYSNWGLLMC